MYQIINRYSFKPLEIAGWGTADGSLADQWDYIGGYNYNQQFSVQSAANGSYLLTPMHTSGKCLEVLGWSGAHGGAVDMWSYSGTGANNQNWLIQPTDNGFYKIINVNSGKALEITLGNNPAVPLRNGSAADQYDYSGGKNQQWAFVKYRAEQKQINLIAPHLIPLHTRGVFYKFLFGELAINTQGGNLDNRFLQ